MTNPFKPTVIVNGTVLYSDPSTLPSSITNSNVYINLNSSGAITGDLIPNESICDVFSAGFTLDYAGGRFNVITGSQFANIAQIITFFGLPAAVTAVGPAVTNTEIGTQTSGVFGSLQANKQLNLLLYGSAANQLLINPALAQANSNFGLTVKAVAQMVATAAGIGLQWLANDLPILQLNLQSTMTGIAALQYLASMVNATVRWSGINSYTVTYPNATAGGTWTLPDCQLLASGGIRAQNLYDLETGLTGTSDGNLYVSQVMNVAPIQSGANLATSGTSVLPVSTILNNETSTTTSGGTLFGQGPIPPIQQWRAITKALTVNDPDIAVDLPIDYDAVYIQIVVPDANFAGSQYTVPASQQSTQWFLLPGPIQTINRGNIYVPQVLIQADTFPPTDTSVQNGNFTMNIGITRKIPQKQFNDLAASSFDLQSYLLSKNLFRWVKTYTGTIQCLFYGVIPLPGMYLSATANGVTVEGVCESVSFSSPGILTMQVAQYARANFNTPFANQGNPAYQNYFTPF